MQLGEKTLVFVYHQTINHIYSIIKSWFDNDSSRKEGIIKLFSLPLPF